MHSINVYHAETRFLCRLACNSPTSFLDIPSLCTELSKSRSLRVALRRMFWLIARMEGKRQPRERSLIGSCCPDILSCSHLPADFLIHYGHACLTPTDAIPVRYVFPRQKLDVSAAAASLYAAAFAESEPTERKRAALVVWDVAYDWLSGELSVRRLAKLTL